MNNLKIKWFRRISVLAVLLFLLNTNLAFCACLAGEPASEQETNWPLQEKSCHCSRPDAAGGDQPSEPAVPEADTCPLCHCVFTENSGHAAQAVAAPPGTPSGTPVATAAVESPVFYAFQEHRFGSEPPLRFVRPQILYLLHRALLN